MDSQRAGLVLVLRPAPRPLRVWGRADALLYNLMTMNLAVMFAVPLLATLAFFPRGHLPLAILLAGALCCCEAAVYAFLASSMPRSGGDYFFQSRTLSGSVGAVCAFTGIVLGGALWMAIAGWFAAEVAVGPVLVMLGRLQRNAALLRAGAFVQSGDGILTVSLFAILWSSLVNVWGLRVYAYLQRVFWVVGGVALLALLVVLLARPQGLGDAAAFRAASAIAEPLGFDARGGSMVWATLALVPVAAFSLIYPAWSVQQAGELLDASRLRSQMLTILVAEAVTVGLSASAVAVVLSVMGETSRAGLSAAAYLFLAHRDLLPVPTVPFYWFFDGGWWPGGFAVVCLGVAINAWFWMWVPDITLAASRVLLAMSSDWALPRWVGHLSGRRGVPARAVWVFAAMCTIPVVLYAYTGFWRMTLAATLLNVLAFAVTCAGGALFPFLRREQYRESTAAPYALFGVPLITILGALFVAFAAVLVWRFAVDGALALGSSRALVIGLSLGLYAAALLLHLAVRWWLRRRRRGLEGELTFRVVGEE